MYYVSKARITVAKQQFSSVRNDYELHLEADTQITPVPLIVAYQLNIISVRILSLFLLFGSTLSGWSI